MVLNQILIMVIQIVKEVINSYNDGIQAKAKLIINGGTYNIKTFKDGSSANFNKDLYSAKGIKVSTNETSNISLLITGGTFNLNTADDSIHSDGNLTITAGTFIISSGDDAVHADQYLILGKNGDDNNLIKLNVTKSYEGLEGAQVYIYSGTYRVIASDDGINAAGDTTDLLVILLMNVDKIICLEEITEEIIEDQDLVLDIEI